MSYETGSFRTGSPQSRKHPGSLPLKAHLLEQVQNKARDSLLLTLKWDRPMVCLTMFGVTELIFHRSSFLCSQGSFSTGRKWEEEQESHG